MIKIENLIVINKEFTKANANVIGEGVTLYNVRLMKKDNKYFLGFPSVKGNDGKYYKIYDVKGEAYTQILNMLINNYEDTIKYDDLDPTEDNWNPID